MTYTISSSELEVSIKETGMELCSIKSKSTGKELMWQGDPAFWANHAPVLFPIIGALKDGVTTIDGKEYAIPKHGLLRYSEKPTLKEKGNDFITFQLHWDDETLALYPYKFIFEVTFSVDGNKLTISHKVINEDEKELLYNLGGHPAFNCPAMEHEVYEDYYLEFEKSETLNTWLLDSSGLVTDIEKPVIEHSKILPLTDTLFNDDALIFRNLISRRVTLKSRKSGGILSVQFDGFPYLGIWAKPEAPFVCIEPWHGLTDHAETDGEFTSKEILRNLAAGESEEMSYSVEVLLN